MTAAHAKILSVHIYMLPKGVGFSNHACNVGRHTVPDIIPWSPFGGESRWCWNMVPNGSGVIRHQPDFIMFYRLYAESEVVTSFIIDILIH